MSANDGIAVASADFVCLFDSYEVELACGDLAWTDTVRFGRRGKGPGELGTYGFLVSSSPDRVAFIDPQNDRISLFNRRGYTGQLDRAKLLTPASDIASDGSYFAYMSIPLQRPGEIVVLEHNTALTGPVRDLQLAIDTLQLRGRPVLATGAARMRNGEFVVRVANGNELRLAIYSAAGDFTGFLDMPDREPRLPDIRDVEIFKEKLAVLPKGPAFDRTVRNFASKPLRHLPGSDLYRIVQQDPAGRLLVLTTDRSSSGTFLETYAGLDYEGRAHLQGRVLSIQVLDSILVTLTEEMPADDLIPARRLDWYALESNGQLRE
jgi:hypothetical protein